MVVRSRKRFKVFTRDDFTCQYCGAHPPEAELQVDHIIPIANGGKDTLDNLRTSCASCNQGRVVVENTKQVKITRDKVYERYSLLCEFCDWQIQFREYESAVKMRTKHLNSVKHFKNTRDEGVKS